MKALIALCLLAVACNDKKPKDPEAGPNAQKGRQVYLANCIACHSADPKQDGALGPAIAGASRDLIEARVMRAAYPEGYKPKRETKTMVALPHLNASLDDLAAY